MARKNDDDPNWPSAGPGRVRCQPCGLEISARGKAAHKRACFGWQPAHHPLGDCAPDPGASNKKRYAGD